MTVIGPIDEPLSFDKEVQGAIHNKLVGQIVAAMVKPPLAAGGSFADILVIAESVLLGIMLVGKTMSYTDTDAVLDTLVKSVKDRIAEDAEGAKSCH